MRNFLAGDAGARELARILRGPRPLIALDYDGTLAPIVKKAGAARIPAHTQKLLDEVVRRYPTVIVSGRSSRDLAERFPRGPYLLIGNHGMDWARPRYQQRGSLSLVDRWRPVLHAALDGVPGIEIEDKRFTFSIHYRLARRPGLARERILEVIHRLPSVRAVGGKRVFNLLPRGALDKGTALERLIRRGRYSGALFVGDDVTDEDGFRARMARGPHPRILGVKVGRDEGSRAPYYLSRQPAIDRLLALILRIGRIGRTAQVARTGARA